MNWSLLDRLRGRANPRTPPAASRPGRARRRGIRVEQLERRDLLAFGDLPFGAMPDDTGEYMLGDIRVNVVYLESDATMTKPDGSAADNGSVTYRLPTNPPINQTYNYTPENWSNWTQSALDNLRGKIANGLSWWEQTLRNKFPKAPSDALRFSIDWTHADNPVHTAYEPIARISDDFQQWIYDFLGQTGFDQHESTGGFSPDVRAFNNFTRQQANSDWAFTIFVVNDLNDPNDRFSQFTGLGSFTQAFAFAGGQFMVVPASRGFETFAHETGHMFWGLDEYPDTDLVFNPQTGQWEQSEIPDEYAKRRGYYNTQNLNAADNPTPGFIQEDSIMANGPQMQRAAANHTSSRSTLEMIGWKDADNDGIMDVLDVSLELTGSGQYDLNTGRYFFNGSTKVRTLPNQNPSGLQNDITLNQIRAIEYSVDGGVTWQRHTQTFAPRTYQTNISFNFEVPDGETTVKIRTVDTRTGVKSNEYTGVTDGPAPASPGVSGFVFSDDDGDGSWDNGEAALPDYGIDVLDENGEPLDLLRWVEPSEWPPLTVLDTIEPGATLSSTGFDTGNVKSVISLITGLASAAGRVFATTNSVNQNVATWTEDRRLRIDFGDLQSNVSLHAYGAASGATFARLEAFSSGGVLLERITSSALSPNTLRLMAFNRPSADISYVLAYGHNSSVVFDTLEWGPASSTTSDALGAYSLNTLPDGVYQVQVTPPSPSHVITTPPGGIAFVTVAGGMSVGSVNFGVHIDVGNGPPFHNAPSPLNVNNDPRDAVSPIDAILIINWLNAHPGVSAISGESDPDVIGYIDVDGNDKCTPFDAILVINFLNLPINPPGGEGLGEADGPSGTLPSAGSKPASGASLIALTAEGETALLLSLAQDATGPDSYTGPPRTAAEYFAQNPLHFDEIPGADLPCSCARCLPVQEGPLTSQMELASALEAIAADASAIDVKLDEANSPPGRFSLRLLTAKGR